MVNAAIASAVGVTSATGVFLITAATYVGISLVTSWALSALAPKPSFGDATSRGLLVNQKDAISPHDFVYGEVRKGHSVLIFVTEDFSKSKQVKLDHPIKDEHDVVKVM